jgi:hypothetical protein
MRYLLFCLVVLGGLTQAHAASLEVELEVPKLDADPYFRPYVAVWLETPERKPVATLSLWYQVETAKGQEDGTKWLKDLRQWWRKLGRASGGKVDGVTGATRRPGVYAINWQDSSLGDGEYLLNFEAAREDGGRSYQRVPINFAEPETLTIPADNELGLISIKVKSQ